MYIIKLKKDNYNNVWFTTQVLKFNLSLATFSKYICINTSWLLKPEIQADVWSYFNPSKICNILSIKHLILI